MSVTVFEIISEQVNYGKLKQNCEDAVRDEIDRVYDEIEDCKKYEEDIAGSEKELKKLKNAMSELIDLNLEYVVQEGLENFETQELLKLNFSHIEANPDLISFAVDKAGYCI